MGETGGTSADMSLSGLAGAARRGAWTPEELVKLRRMWEDDQSLDDMARKLGGRTVNAVSVKAARLGLPPRRRPEGEPLVRRPDEGYRACLCCRVDFWSQGKHHRICDVCKSSDSWSSGSVFGV